MRTVLGLAMLVLTPALCAALLSWVLISRTNARLLAAAAAQSRVMQLANTAQAITAIEVVRDRLDAVRAQQDINREKIASLEGQLDTTAPGSWRTRTTEAIAAAADVRAADSARLKAIDARLKSLERAFWTSVAEGCP